LKIEKNYFFLRVDSSDIRRPYPARIRTNF